MVTYAEIAESRLLGKLIAGLVILLIIGVIACRPYGFELNEENKTIFVFILGGATALLFK